MSRLGARVIGSDMASSRGYQIPEGWKNGPGDSEDKDLLRRKRLPMYVCMEPCTKLDLTKQSSVTHTYIQMFKRTEELIEIIQEQSAEQLEELMKLGRKMAKAHHDRFKNFSKLPPKPACLLLGGDGLQADSMKASEQKYFCKNVRFICGLYGVIRPYDDVKPVRDMPMGAKLKTKYGDSLDEFWGDSIQKQLSKDFKFESEPEDDKPLLVCVMSEDYWVAVQPNALRQFIPVLVIFEGGNPENTGRGRGLLVRHLTKKQANDVEEIKNFEDEDWELHGKRSSDCRLIFTYVGEATGAAASSKKDKKKKDQGSDSEDAGSDEPQKKSKKDKKGQVEDRKRREKDSDASDSASPPQATGRQGQVDDRKRRGKDSDAPRRKEKPRKGRDLQSEDASASPPPRREKKSKRRCDSESCPREQPARDSRGRRGAPARDSRSPSVRRASKRHR